MYKWIITKENWWWEIIWKLFYIQPKKDNKIDVYQKPYPVIFHRRYKDILWKKITYYFPVVPDSIIKF